MLLVGLQTACYRKMIRLYNLNILIWLPGFLHHLNVPHVICSKKSMQVTNANCTGICDYAIP